MQTNNPLYQNQGIHVVNAIFTVDNNKFKVLLLKRKNNPFYGYWALVSGAVYNNETLENAVNRELKEKVKMDSVNPIMFDLFSNPNRAKETGYRMLGVGYMAFVDNSAISFVKESAKVSNVEWWDIENLPPLAYDHKEILDKAIEFLKVQIFKSDIVKVLFPNGVTIPELQNVYEKVLMVKLDRRNFRKKILQIGLIQDTNKTIETGGKPAKLYKINSVKDDFNF